MNTCRLVVSDLDGTLFNDQKEVPPQNLIAIDRLLDHGIFVIFATARDVASIKIKIPLQHPGLFYIGSGGGLIYQVDGDRVIWEETLDLPLIEECINFLSRYNQMVFLNSLNDYWVDREEPRLEMIKKRYSMDATLFTHAADIKAPIHRVSLGAPVEILEKATQEAYGHFGSRANVSLASPDWLDLFPPKSGKGHALKAFQSLLGIEPSQTMVIGDYDSDLVMFEHAHYRIAMGNAKPIVKQAATFVTLTNNEGGVAEVLNTITV